MNNQDKISRIVQNQIFKYLFMFLLVGVLFSSCNEGFEDNIPVNETDKISLSISMEEKMQIRSSEKPDSINEKSIYSLEVLIFKTDGTLDSYTSIPRKLINVSGLTYDKSYAEINEVKNIDLTRGIRDIYVVANAPDNYFAGVKSFTNFSAKYESLSTQGLFLASGATSNVNTGNPNSGYPASDWKTNLTMCGSALTVDFTGQATGHYYIGYTANPSGLPTGISDGKAPLSNNPFLVERLAARVAIKSITFNLPTTLDFGSGQGAIAFEQELDSVFMINAKIQSRFANNSTESNNNFGYGNVAGYNLLKSTLTNIASGTYCDYLREQIVPDYNGNYDIENMASTPIDNTPLWFYVFENNTQKTTNPTYFVISVKYFFKDASLQTKMMKAYYPVVINNSNGNLIERNNQYRLAVTIKSLGLYKSTIMNTKSLSETDSFIDVTEEVGQNLFPWTGNIYK